jgi:hypothetical protein
MVVEAVVMFWVSDPLGCPSCVTPAVGEQSVIPSSPPAMRSESAFLHLILSTKCGARVVRCETVKISAQDSVKFRECHTGQKNLSAQHNLLFQCCSFAPCKAITFSVVLSLLTVFLTC